MDKHMSIYGVTSAAYKFCPILPKNKNEDPETILHQFLLLTQFLFLICRFLIFQKILIFGGLGFLSDLYFFSCLIPVSCFPDNLMSSVVSNNCSYFYTNSGFLIFQTILVLVVATILRDPAVVFLQSARNQ